MGVLPVPGSSRRRGSRPYLGRKFLTGNGLAAQYPGRYDSPVSLRLTGLHINQEDDPWWLSATLAWIAMYNSIMNSPWEQAEGWRSLLEQELQRKPPACLYEIYKNFNRRLESWMREQQSKASRKTV